ncbi:MAG TPA: sensor histidine kinase [Vicinamibacterales bacterium]|nr:sensor histidine kinase [Vicinamibacterales bacterium]
MQRRKFIPAPLLFAIATAFGISSTFQAYWLDSLSHEHPMPHQALHLLAINLVYWYIPALLAPTIMAFALRHPFDRAHWPKRVVVHAAAALSYSVVHTAVLMAVRMIIVRNETLPANFPGWWQVSMIDYLQQLDWLLMTYLFLIGVAFALEYRRESESRALDTSQLETRLVEAQLQSLQRQLHPHFLFNTLNTISGLLRTDPDGADRMIDSLGDLLRMTLHKSGVQEVPLKEELDVLQKYVEIEQTRFGSRLKFETHIQPEVLDAHVPSLVLQTLVENAIRHGIAPNTRPGSIVVTAVREDSELLLQIRDSGDGLPPDRLMALNRGVGLDNTRARLEHLYRGRYQFTFANLERGLCVTIRIPFQADTPSDIEAGAA